MNVIELAEKAGFGISNQYKTPEVLDGDGYGFITNEIEAFADLVRAEALAEAKEHFGKQLVGFRASVREQSLEEAAKVAEEMIASVINKPMPLKDIVDVIRKLK